MFTKTTGNDACAKSPFPIRVSGFFFFFFTTGWNATVSLAVLQKQKGEGSTHRTSDRTWFCRTLMEALTWLDPAKKYRYTNSYISMSCSWKDMGWAWPDGIGPLNYTSHSNQTANYRFESKCLIFWKVLLTWWSFQNFSFLSCSKVDTVHSNEVTCSMPCVPLSLGMVHCPKRLTHLKAKTKTRTHHLQLCSVALLLRLKGLVTYDLS